MARSKKKVLPKNIGSRRLLRFSADYDKTLGQAIDECGLKREGNTIYSGNYPNQPHEKGVVDLVGKLFHFGCPAEPWVPAAVMDQKGFRPATPLEVLALVKKFPNEYRKYPIVALGSPVKGVINKDAFVSVGLDNQHSRPEVGLSVVYAVWHGYRHFLGILKTEVPALEA